jgi:UDP:flavonoid glycosyltransferase YjiC (YdhE family)
MQAHATDDMTLALVALSPTLLPRPDDWHPRIHVSGFLGLPASAEQWTPEPGLQSFLDTGEPPLFLTFGSMLTLDDGRAAESVGVFAEALELAGARGVVQAQASVIANAPRSARIHYLERAPHAQVFPRCAAVVHHGGAGTTQSALLAGKPSVIVPHAADQFFFADLLHARGCASKPLKRNALAPKALAARMRRVLDDPTFATQAKTMGEALAREDGAPRAADLIEASAS